MNRREKIRDKKRIVVKIGSSSLFYAETNKLNYGKIEKLVRILTDTANSGKEVILVSSGAIATGRSSMGLPPEENSIPVRQACAAIGQAQLITVYQRLFADYGRTAAQILLTRYTIHSELTRNNAANTFKELLKMGVIPVVNENDTVTTEEIEFGDNDCLSAMVAVLSGADLLILLSDIDGLYDSDPRKNPDASFIPYVDDLEAAALMGEGSTGSSYGTGGMASKIEAAQIANGAGIDMVIANASEPENISAVLRGEDVGTLFGASGAGFSFEEFDIRD